MLKLDNVLDVLELGLSPPCIFAVLAAETTKNVAGFFVSANLDEPARGLGEEPDDAKEDKERNDLEGDGESPSDSRIAAIDEREATAVY